MILCRSETASERLLRAQDTIRALLCMVLMMLCILGWTAYQRAKDVQVMEGREAYITALEARTSDLSAQVAELKGQVDAMQFEAVVKPVSRGADMKRLSLDELRELAGTVHAEAQGEPFKGKMLVARVVINRMNWNPDMSLHQILIKPNQFATGTEYTSEDLNAVYAAMAETEYSHISGFHNPDTATNPEADKHVILHKVGKHVFW